MDVGLFDWEWDLKLGLNARREVLNLMASWTVRSELRFGCLERGRWDGRVPG